MSVPRESAVAAELWGSIAAALRLSCLRTYGPEALDTVELESTARDVRRAVALLALPEVEMSNSRRAARLGLTFSRSIGTTAIAVDTDPQRAWLIEFPPGPLSDSPFSPSTSMAVASSSLGRAWAAAKSSELLVRLQVDNVKWVHVRSQAAGHVVEAGYFAASEDTTITYEWNPLEQPPKVRATPLDIEPTDPLIADFILWQVAHRIDVLYEYFGEVDGRALVELAFRIVLVGRWDWLFEQLSVPRSAADRGATQLDAAIRQITDEWGRDSSGSHRTVGFPSGLARRCTTASELIDAAWRSAFDTAALQSGFGLVVQRDRASGSPTSDSAALRRAHLPWRHIRQ